MCLFWIISSVCSAHCTTPLIIFGILKILLTNPLNLLNWCYFAHIITQVTEPFAMSLCCTPRKMLRIRPHLRKAMTSRIPCYHLLCGKLRNARAAKLPHSRVFVTSSPYVICERPPTRSASFVKLAFRHSERDICLLITRRGVRSESAGSQTGVDPPRGDHLPKSCTIFKNFI